MSNAISITDNEIFKGTVKAAYLNSDGDLRMCPGHAGDREAVEAFLEKREAEIASIGKAAPEADKTSSSSPTLPDGSPVTEHSVEKAVATALSEQLEAKPSPIPGKPLIVLPTGKDISAFASKASVIVCPIAGSPQLGSKDPEVIRWWVKNHPAEAKNRYSRRLLDTIN